jgi:hypothetical protein
MLVFSEALPDRYAFYDVIIRRSLDFSLWGALGAVVAGTVFSTWRCWKHDPERRLHFGTIVFWPRFPASREWMAVLRRSLVLSTLIFSVGVIWTMNMPLGRDFHLTPLWWLAFSAGFLFFSWKDNKASPLWAIFAFLFGMFFLLIGLASVNRAL